GGNERRVVDDLEKPRLDQGGRLWPVDALRQPAGDIGFGHACVLLYQDRADGAADLTSERRIRLDPLVQQPWVAMPGHHGADIKSRLGLEQDSRRRKRATVG